jgi:hypothetical protein
VDPLCAGIYLPNFYLVTAALNQANAAGSRAAVSLPSGVTYVLAHRVAVWEVVDANRPTKNIAKTARHFRWPPA